MNGQTDILEVKQKEIGGMIRKMRKSVHLNQQELSERVKIERQVLSKIERGLTDVHLHQLFQMADACGYKMSIDVVKPDKPSDLDKPNNVISFRRDPT